jgi:hypothetical protein
VPNLSYRIAAPILSGGGGILPSLMQIIRPDDPEPVQLRLSVLTGGQPGKTNGHHIRVVPVPSGVRGLLADRDPRLAVAAQERIDILARVERAIRFAIATGWRAGRALKVQRDSRGRSDLSVAEPFVAAWMVDEDAIFFPDLWSEVVAHDPQSVRKRWVQRLVNTTGPTVATIGITAVVPETDARWKARALATDAYWCSVRKLRTEFLDLDATEEAA